MPIIKKSVTLPLYRLSLASSDLKVWILWAWLSHKLLGTGVCLGLAGFFLQGFELCLSFLLCNRTGWRWRAVSKHYLSRLVQNICSCPPFSLLNNAGCVTLHQRVQAGSRFTFHLIFSHTANKNLFILNQHHSLPPSFHTIHKALQSFS